VTLRSERCRVSHAAKETNNLGRCQRDPPTAELLRPDGTESRQVLFTTLTEGEATLLGELFRIGSRRPSPTLAGITIWVRAIRRSDNLDSAGKTQLGDALGASPGVTSHRRTVGVLP
jgi:hypothetical protein